MLPSGSGTFPGNEIIWKDMVMTENFFGDAVTQTTTDQTDPRMDYLDSIDVIFAMHREYMPIIREFRCYEDAMGKISGYEIDYHHKPVLKTGF